MEEEGRGGGGWKEPVLLLGRHMHVQTPLGGDKRMETWMETCSLLGLLGLWGRGSLAPTTVHGNKR